MDLAVATLPAVAPTYAWQCLDCKVCSVCRSPTHEELLLMCDHCDRGFHTFCVGLAALPEGHWECTACANCASCGEPASPPHRAVRAPETCCSRPPKE